MDLPSVFSKCLYRIHDLVLSESVHSVEWNLWRFGSRPLVNYWTNLSPTRVQDGPLSSNVIETLATTEIGDLRGNLFREKWLNWYSIKNMTPIIKQVTNWTHLLWTRRVVCWKGWFICFILYRTSLFTISSRMLNIFDIHEFM